MSWSGLVFGSRRFLKKVASRDSEKSFGVGSVEESQAARTPGEILPEDNKVSFALYFVFLFVHVFVIVFVYVFVFGELLLEDNKVSLALYIVIIFAFVIVFVFR